MFPHIVRPFTIDTCRLRFVPEHGLAVTFVPRSSSRSLQTPAHEPAFEPLQKHRRLDHEILEVNEFNTPQVSEVASATPNAVFSHRHESCETEATSPQDTPGLSQTDENIISQRLMRHFREGPGQWYALENPSAYFRRLSEDGIGWTFSIQGHTIPAGFP